MSKIIRFRVELTEYQYHATLAWFLRAEQMLPRVGQPAVSGVAKLEEAIVARGKVRPTLSTTSDTLP